MISTYEIHHTTTPCRQLLTAERTQNEGVMDAFYIQEVTPKVVANAVRIVIRICKIFFQTGLFIIVNNGFEQFLHTCRRTSHHMKRSNTLIANGLHRHSTARNCKVNDDILIRSGGASSLLPHPPFARLRPSFNAQPQLLIDPERPLHPSAQASSTTHETRPSG